MEEQGHRTLAPEERAEHARNQAAYRDLEDREAATAGLLDPTPPNLIAAYRAGIMDRTEAREHLFASPGLKPGEVVSARRAGLLSAQEARERLHLSLPAPAATAAIPRPCRARRAPLRAIWRQLIYGPGR